MEGLKLLSTLKRGTRTGLMAGEATKATVEVQGERYLLLGRRHPRFRHRFCSERSALRRRPWEAPPLGFEKGPPNMGGRRSKNGADAQTKPKNPCTASMRMST